MMKDNELHIELDGSIFIIKYPEINYGHWKSLIPFENDEDISVILSNIAVNLDCSIVFSNQRLLMTTHMMYEYYVSEYYYYLLHIDNQKLYNFHFDRLCNIHKDNIKFELDNPIIPYVAPTKKKSTKQKLGGTKFVRQVTTDLITNKVVYLYSNSKTGEVIKSEDPDMLDTLNAKPVKVKRSKVIDVPLEAMTFSFKKK